MNNVTKCIIATIVGLTSVSTVATPQLTNAQNKYVSHLKSKAEPSVLDAVWMTSDNLYVGRLNNGQDQSGFAQYVCEDAVDHNAGAKMVKIIDVAQVARTGKFVAIGQAYCK